MKNLVRFIGDRYLSSRLDFRVRLFNVLAIAGIMVSAIATALSTANGEPVLSALLNATTGVVAIALLRYASRSGRYQLCYIITIVVIFLIAFPAIFFTGGGDGGAMPLFFVFSILFTVFMLEGAIALSIALIELLAYIGLLVCAYHYPEFVTALPTRFAELIDKIVGLIIVSASLGITMFLHFRMYNRQQRELEAAREEALRLSEVKNVFLANMSHEIRTPINVMLGMTEMVLRDSRDETVSEYALKIQNAGKMLLVLVSNILDVSKIESGKLEMAEDQYRTAVLIQELDEIGAESARRRGLAFNVQTDESLPSELYGDSLRIKQIISNFLSNAAKYTSAGTITLSFENAGISDSGTVTLRVAVTDTGVGIKKENLAVLFDAFARLDLPSHRSIEGTGLGLKIAKDLTERMNGKILVESRYGEGSVFWVEIPQAVADPKPLGDWQPASGGKDGGDGESFIAPEARILIVDDNEENLQTVKTLLRRTLMRIDAASGGMACVESAKNARYDLILLDYMMPDMDGVETLRRLREELPNFRTPVIALTANAVSGFEERLLSEGFAAYLTKPVHARELEEAIACRLPPELVTSRTVREGWASRELLDTLSRSLDPFGVSLEEGLKSSGGDLSLLARMAEAFTDSYPSARERMSAALSDTGENGLDAMLHLAHSLKSSAGFVGATYLSALAARAERACAIRDAEALSLVTPLLYHDWDMAKSGLHSFAAHVRAVEPVGKPEARGFSLSRLRSLLGRRIRAEAIAELDMLIREHGEDSPPEIQDAKNALRELDFDGARHLLIQAGILEASDG